MDTYDDAKRAIDGLFSDRSVPAERTRELLEQLIEEMQIMVDALESDLCRQ